jgi:hypothetical protein
VGEGVGVAVGVGVGGRVGISIASEASALASLLSVFAASESLGTNMHKSTIVAVRAAAAMEKGTTCFPMYLPAVESLHAIPSRRSPIKALARSVNFT